MIQRTIRRSRFPWLTHNGEPLPCYRETRRILLRCVKPPGNLAQKREGSNPEGRSPRRAIKPVPLPSAQCRTQYPSSKETSEGCGWGKRMIKSYLQEMAVLALEPKWQQWTMIIPLIGATYPNPQTLNIQITCPCL